jgi:hypothetical protein
MPLAHTVTGGPNTEILLLGAGMVVLALVFFFQKTASRKASVVLLVLGAVAITGAFTFAGPDDGGGDGHHDVAISIVSPRDGATVETGPIELDVELTGATLAAESTDEDGGHMHVYIDGEVAAMPPTLDITVEFPPGEHELEVEYVDAEHRALDPPVRDSVTVTAE